MDSLGTRHAWYSANMHRYLAMPNYQLDDEGEGVIGEMKPDDVIILPDGKVATFITDSLEHGCKWGDMVYLGEYPFRGWPKKPADQVPIRQP